ncbi:MAG: polymer-forming cytoskeletal protein [Deltaproteobacteria bacterium]|nr:polymer-forming cytoskeletal protein [Deltaproteobacteria bacterium]
MMIFTKKDSKVEYENYEETQNIKKENKMPLGKKDEVMKDPTSLNAILGKGSRFEGKLTFEGTVRIEGDFTGEIFSEDTLVIGEGAHIQAEISVGSVSVYGEIKGNIIAQKSCELHAPAKVVGNIVTGNLMIESGVIFEGNCKTDKSISLSKSQTSHPSPVKINTDIPKV